ncbi:MAG: DNA repair exonuclease [Trueperaceae bacterium]
MTLASRQAGSSSVRLLCAADIHLGKQPSRVPASLLDSYAPRALSPTAAWFRLVDTALSERVDAVVLAGDVVEQSDDFYEAYADLRKGVERLAEAGVRVLGVAGNHDVDVLPRLAAAVSGFTLLGAGGEWEELTLEGTGGARLRLLGWSFPRDTVSLNPLAQQLPERGTEITIGLLHCDRDGAVGRYAPVRSADLQAAALDAWLLGHVHKPDPMSGSQPIGYLGSLTGSHPGERGARGAWLLEVSGGRPTMQHLPLAPLRWEELEVPVDELAEAEEVHGRIEAAIDGLHETLAAQAYLPIAVGCRLTLTGRSRHRAAIWRALQAADPRARPHPRDGIDYFIHDLRLRALPAVDLEELARVPDPAGLLARRLLLIRGPEDAEERAELLRSARARLEPIAERRQFRPLAEPPLPDAEIASLLEAAALEALDALLAQKEAGP